MNNRSKASKVNGTDVRSALVGRRVQRDRWGEPTGPFTQPDRSDPASGPTGLTRFLAYLMACARLCCDRKILGPYKNWGGIPPKCRVTTVDLGGKQVLVCNC